VETEIFDSHLPGGTLSNMESQLKQQSAGDRLDDQRRAMAGALPIQPLARSRLCELWGLVFGVQCRVPLAGRLPGDLVA
jgi:hypothetical protein